MSSNNFRAPRRVLVHYLRRDSRMLLFVMMEEDSLITHYGVISEAGPSPSKVGSGLPSGHVILQPCRPVGKHLVH